MSGRLHEIVDELRQHRDGLVVEALAEIDRRLGPEFTSGVIAGDAEEYREFDTLAEKLDYEADVHAVIAACTDYDGYVDWYAVEAVMYLRDLEAETRYEEPA